MVTMIRFFASPDFKGNGSGIAPNEDGPEWVSGADLGFGGRLLILRCGWFWLGRWGWGVAAAVGAVAAGGGGQLGEEFGVAAEFFADGDVEIVDEALLASMREFTRRGSARSV